MSGISDIQVKEKKENNALLNIKGELRVEKLPFHVADDDPVLLRKEQACIKSFYEIPWPEEVLQRMVKRN